MTTEEEEKKKFLGELEEMWNLVTHNEYLQIVFWTCLWVFIIVMWTYEALFIGDIISILGAIIFDSLGIFYIYNDIKKWKAIKLNSMKTN